MYVLIKMDKYINVTSKYKLFGLNLNINFVISPFRYKYDELISMCKKIMYYDYCDDDNFWELYFKRQFGDKYDKYRDNMKWIDFYEYVNNMNPNLLINFINNIDPFLDLIQQTNKAINMFEISNIKGITSNIRFSLEDAKKFIHNKLYSLVDYLFSRSKIGFYPEEIYPSGILDVLIENNMFKIISIILEAPKNTILKFDKEFKTSYYQKILHKVNILKQNNDITNLNYIKRMGVQIN